MVVLVIQIPCLNEEKTLPTILSQIPKKLNGVDKIITLVIDDGSTDNTVKVAEEFGCEIVSHKKNRGLGRAFKSGMYKAIDLKADILVNIDGDNQYPLKYVSDLIKPVVEGKADIVIGDRQTFKIKHFSFVKRFFQFFGSLTVRFLTSTGVSDTVSGFRAYSKDAICEINVTSEFSYVLDSIVQASKKGLCIKEIKITTNKPTRKSRLFNNIFEHIKRSGSILLRVYVMYEPLKVFIYLSFIFFVAATFLLIRFFIYYFSGVGGHVQSLIICGILYGANFFLLGLGILGDINNKNRFLIEETLTNQKRKMYDKK